MRETYIMRGGHLVTKAEACAMDAHQREAAPGVISDNFRNGDALWHPCTGEMVDSKSRFREITKRHGGEEIGTEVQRDRRKYDAGCSGNDVRRAVEMLQGGYRPQLQQESF